ncbi:hypothetical protein CSOJ01_15608 [Colletotrichum sojae]|uniref:Uncharacterized protein n=1 Tax=Colletotrichum sojae TaxID=2175907 RepID=A0A8H6IMS2_9PEZI|nr:hypothetical protein CSOJ01_15608 [Colletotrichum sojae]
MIAEQDGLLDPAIRCGGRSGGADDYPPRDEAFRQCHPGVLNELGANGARAEGPTASCATFLRHSLARLSRPSCQPPPSAGIPGPVLPHAAPRRRNISSNCDAVRHDMSAFRRGDASFEGKSPRDSCQQRGPALVHCGDPIPTSGHGISVLLSPPWSRSSPTTPAAPAIAAACSSLGSHVRLWPSSVSNTAGDTHRGRTAYNVSPPLRRRVARDCDALRE